MRLRPTVLAAPLLAVAALPDAALSQPRPCLRIREADLVEEWRYTPSESAPAAQVVGRPEWVARTPGGSVFVLDVAGPRIVRLDARGRFSAAFGRRGQGPGELLSPASVRAAPNGEVAVLDDGQSRAVFFSEGGEHRRTVRLVPTLFNARDFLVLADGRIAVSGTAAGSPHAVHLFGPDGRYLAGYGSLRTDLEEPVLRERYSDGALAELAGGALAFAQRTPFRLQVFRGGARVLDRTDPRVVPDYARRVARREGAGWRFDWRHPRLTSLLPSGDGCYVVAVQVPPDEERTTVADFRTTVFVLDAAGRVASETRLDRFFWGTQLWRDAQGIHVLGFGMDRETEALYPVQYRIAGSGSRAAPARARAGSRR